MGMYTALVLDARLKADTPQDVIETLTYMVADDKPDEEKLKLPDHPLFGDTRWSWMLRCSSGSFPIERAPHLRQLLCGYPVGVWELSVGCSIKNYDDEIGLFLDWLKPHVVEALGYTIYEEDPTITPILINWRG
jgi:hypothetical protein